MKYKPILPKRWNSNLAYIFGLLIGDGSLPKTKSKRPNGKFQKRYHEVSRFFKEYGKKVKAI